LFDGVEMGMAVSHWDRGSIFSPAFHVGLGFSTGPAYGVHVGVPAYHGPLSTSYRHGQVGYAVASSCWYCWDPWYQGWDPYYWDWWDYGHPYGYGWSRLGYRWDPYRYGWGRHYRTRTYVSLGLGWSYYRRPVYFDPWWGWTGYLARWRPVWAYSPGWWYYNDPWYVSPGYSRVAYVVPSQRV